MFESELLYSFLSEFFNETPEWARHYIHLKVPSHQIRLCLKCYGWIGLDEYKDRGW